MTTAGLIRSTFTTVGVTSGSGTAGAATFSTGSVFSAGCTGCVFGYNFGINNQQSGTIIQFPYYAHTPGNEFDLWEGNAYDGVKVDSSSFGASTNGTFFRNNLSGWQLGKSQYTTCLLYTSDAADE